MSAKKTWSALTPAPEAVPAESKTDEHKVPCRMFLVDLALSDAERRAPVEFSRDPTEVLKIGRSQVVSLSGSQQRIAENVHVTIHYDPKQQVYVLTHVAGDTYYLSQECPTKQELETKCRNLHPGNEVTLQHDNILMFGPDCNMEQWRVVKVDLDQKLPKECVKRDPGASQNRRQYKSATHALLYTTLQRRGQLPKHATEDKDLNDEDEERICNRIAIFINKHPQNLDLQRKFNWDRVTSGVILRNYMLFPASQYEIARQRVRSSKKYSNSDKQLAQRGCSKLIKNSLVLIDSRFRFDSDKGKERAEKYKKFYAHNSSAVHGDGLGPTLDDILQVYVNTNVRDSLAYMNDSLKESVMKIIKQEVPKTYDTSALAMCKDPVLVEKAECDRQNYTQKACAEAENYRERFKVMIERSIDRVYENAKDDDFMCATRFKAPSKLPHLMKQTFQLPTGADLKDLRKINVGVCGKRKRVCGEAMQAFGLVADHKRDVGFALQGKIDPVVEQESRALDAVMKLRSSELKKYVRAQLEKHELKCDDDGVDDYVSDTANTAEDRFGSPSHSGITDDMRTFIEKSVAKRMEAHQKTREREQEANMAAARAREVPRGGVKGDVDHSGDTTGSGVNNGGVKLQNNPKQNNSLNSGSSRSSKRDWRRGRSPPPRERDRSPLPREISPPRERPIKRRRYNHGGSRSRSRSPPRRGRKRSRSRSRSRSPRFHNDRRRGGGM